MNLDAKRLIGVSAGGELADEVFGLEAGGIEIGGGAPAEYVAAAPLFDDVVILWINDEFIRDDFSDAVIGADGETGVGTRIAGLNDPLPVEA